MDQLAQYISDGVDRAKAGKALEVYNAVAPHIDNDTLPPKSHYPTGWIIYYALHQAADSAVDIRKRMLAKYLKLRVAKPHKLHSMILTEAIRLYKDAANIAFNHQRDDMVRFSISRFAALWNLENLRPGDWRRKEFEGKQLSSTAEKLITLCVDECMETNTSPSPELTAITDHALSLFPESHSLLYQRASLHILQTQPDQAIPLLKKAILIAPSKHYLWSRLASLVSPEKDLRLHVSLLFRSLSSPGPEQFKGKVRLALAKAWIYTKAYPQALYELLSFKHVYEQNGWHLSRHFNSILSQIPEGTSPDDPTPAYKRVEPIADSFIYDAIPALEVKKTYHKDPPQNAPSKGFNSNVVAWRVTDSEGRHYWIHPHRFKIPPHLPIGTPLKIKLNNGKPVKADLITEPQP